MISLRTNRVLNADHILKLHVFDISRRGWPRIVAPQVIVHPIGEQTDMVWDTATWPAAHNHPGGLPAGTEFLGRSHLLRTGNRQFGASWLRLVGEKCARVHTEPCLFQKQTGTHLA